MTDAVLPFMRCRELPEAAMGPVISRPMLALPGFLFLYFDFLLHRHANFIAHFDDPVFKNEKTCGFQRLHRARGLESSRGRFYVS